MSILWCGGEDIDFPNGNAVSVTNNSGFWSRSGYTRCSLSSSGGISKSTYFPGGPVTSAWITFRWRPDNSAKTVGVGAGQMSRVVSVTIACSKAGLRAKGSTLASDAFFPFRDGLDVVVDAGATCVIQPGGSMRDDEVIAAANERGVAMVYSGVRHFRH